MRRAGRGGEAGEGDAEGPRLYLVWRDRASTDARWRPSEDSLDRPRGNRPPRDPILRPSAVLDALTGAARRERPLQKAGDAATGGAIDAAANLMAG